MSTQTIPERCRIVLITPPRQAAVRLGDALEAALSAGDVASVIVPAHDMDETVFEDWAQTLVPIAQRHGAAAIIAGPPRIAMRVGADGIHSEAPKDELADLVSRYHPKLIVGCGGAKNRDDALELGETQPDYIFFGRFGYDTAPEPMGRNLTLGEWWSQMVAVPCIVQAGSSEQSVAAVAATGCDFVAISTLVFGEGADPAAAIAGANALLDEHAPRLEGAR